MKRNPVLNIILAVALYGMSAALFAEDVAKPAADPAILENAEATEETAASAAAGRAEADEEAAVADAAAGNPPASQSANVNASAAPTLPADVRFDGNISGIGGAAADAESSVPQVKHWLDGKSLERNYFQQPPLIPHKVEEYRITANYNKCLACHSWENYKRSGATKISQTHFKDRDGNDHSTVAARRYFCNQCHVPQVDAVPLVENEFKPVKELSK